VPGDYSLRVEGINDATGARVFSNSTALDFSPRFLTIIVQTSRPIYCNGQDGIFWFILGDVFCSSGSAAVRFRVVLLRMDMKPFDEAVTIFMMVRKMGLRHHENIICIFRTLMVL
jgi:hypothetical protein